MLLMAKKKDLKSKICCKLCKKKKQNKINRNKQMEGNNKDKTEVSETENRKTILEVRQRREFVLWGEKSGKLENL